MALASASVEVTIMPISTGCEAAFCWARQRGAMLGRSTAAARISFPKNELVAIAESCMGSSKIDIERFVRSLTKG
jgi:hypothetical protein